MSPQAIRDEIDKTLNLRKVDGETSKRSTEESREWGKVGLDGLKDAFNRNRVSGSMRKINGSEDVGTDDQRRNDSDQKVQFTNSQIEPPEKNEKKKLQKKTVTFAPQPSSSSSSSSSDVEKTTPRPPRGIMLPDVVERAPVQSVENVQIAQKRVPVPIEKLNGRNGHLNPRLASLLPRSYCERQIGASVNPECGAGDDDQNVEDDDDDDDDDLSSDEKEFDADSVWSEDDEEEGDDKDSNWPPLDLDIQTALDLRQAALEYHSKRNGLGLGPGTGPLGGDRQAPEPDEESEEWVPMDTRAKAEGVPRQLNGSSRFRTGKSLVWDGKIGSNPTGERVTDGKLHGTEPLIQGPEPRAERAAVYQIPGRKSDREGVDEDLTAEEMELLRSRIEILGMDEESRIAAESAGTALMELMEKARRGEVVLESEKDKDHLSEGPVDGRSERPPELKTVTTTKKKNKPAESLSTGKVVERNDLEKQFDSKKTFGSDKIDSLECRKSEEERSEQLKKKGDEDCDIFTGVEVNRGGFKKVSRFKIDRNR
ncbi:hypothetical protein BY996DRAFT_172595 [Phakopsora pachyrhizi]|nr:hypothetical protein BY996DRAFT_172595 [Phakopsora pachyrhizi]